MPQDRNDLPEGTDKIIAGASKQGSGRGGAGGGNQDAGDGGEAIVTVETTLVTERTIPAPSGVAERSTSGSGQPGGTSRRSGGASSGSGGSSSSSSGGGGSDGGSDSSTSVMQKLRGSGEKLSGQAADKARDFVGQGLERSGEALTNVSRLVGDTATGLDERLGPEYGDYARKAADAIERTAQKLRSKDPDQLIDDTRDFVRKSPGIALAGAAIVGFALARLVKSGFEGSSGTSGQGAQDDQPQGRTQGGTGGSSR